MRLFFVLLAFCLLTRCSQTRSSADILPREKMVKVLWDVMEIDEFASEFIDKDSLKKDVRKERLSLYQQVFQIHKVTEKDFAESFKYYSGQPATMKIIYDSLAARGERERRNIYTHKEEKPK